MTISGKSSIAGTWTADDNQPQFQAFNPATNDYFGDYFTDATEEQVGQAVAAAEVAFVEYSGLSRQLRADFLEQVAEQILALGDDLIAITMAESGLPEVRLQGERMRTVNQLKAFATKLREQEAQVIVDLADPERAPLPKPLTELHQIPLGPVAVFGASNFPYAFSVLGGDTASALAAGCPVVVKGHPAHPATSEMMSVAINKAIETCQLPKGVFSLVQGKNPQVSHALVKHPGIKAVGFTGSLAVAKSLQQTINQRPEPIPFYGELGSINPQILLPGLLANSGEALADALVGSLMMGQGQFCTSPGVWVTTAAQPKFVEQVKVAINAAASGALLTPGIIASYNSLKQTIANIDGVELVGENSQSESFHAQAVVFKTSFENFKNNPQLKEEIFGPFALIVECQSDAEVTEFVNALEGQLTASIHGDDNDLNGAQELARQLSFKVGRLIFNQMPTGVEVCASMNHGGPFPASTDIKTTSVGLQAMERFLRPVCLQNKPDFLVL